MVIVFGLPLLVRPQTEGLLDTVCTKIAQVSAVAAVGAQKRRLNDTDPAP